MGWPKGKPRKVSLIDKVLSEPEPARLVEVEEIPDPVPDPDHCGVWPWPTAKARKRLVDVEEIPDPVPDHCGICRFWDKQPEHGLCRRFPAHPRPNDPAARWPVMPATDWCGEFKAK